MRTSKMKNAQSTTAEAPAAPSIPTMTAEEDRINATRQRRQAREAATRDRLAQIQGVCSLLDLDEDQLEVIETVLLMRSRVFCGTDDPISTFIMDLLKQYIWAEDRSEGLSIEDIEFKIEELRTNLAEAISEAYFIADRYPRPGTGDEANTPHVETKS